MTSQSNSDGRNNGRRSRGGSSRRRGGSGGGEFRPRSNNNNYNDAPARAAAPKSLWEKIVGFFSGGNGGNSSAPVQHRSAPSERDGSRNNSRGESREPRPADGAERSRAPRRVETVEVTTPRLYVGNLSFDATESDLFELFNGVGQVQNAEVVTYKHNQRSKGFAFVQMLTVEEAQRAVTELHDKEFLGRKLLVSGAKSSEHHSAS